MKNEKRIDRILLACLLALALGGMLYYGNQKEGYHIDELYSFGLANSEYLPFMHFGEMEYSVKDWMLEYGPGESLADLARNLVKDLDILKENGFQLRNTVIYQDYLRAQANSMDTRTTTWVSGQAYLEYLAASRSNRFNYASVYYNQRGDVHPPLFYIGLHTVSSFFPEHFSKWLGLVPNFLYMLLAIFVLWHMVSRHLGGERLALVVVATFALSKSMVTTAIFLRMYALLTLMVLWCCDSHLELLEKEDRMDRGLHVRLCLSVLLGYLAHYYFVIYVLILAFVMACHMIYRRHWKELVKYVSSMAITALAGILVWPFSIKHVFLGYRGRDSLQTLSGGQYSIWRLQYMTGNFLGSAWGGHWKIAEGILAVLVFGVILLWAGKLIKKGTLDLRIPWAKIALTTLPLTGYVMMVTQITPFLDERYLSCLLPLFYVLFVCGLALVLRGIGECFPALPKKVCDGLVLGMGVLMILLGNYVTHEPGYLFRGGQEKTEVPEQCVCVYVLPDGDWNESANETNVLAKCEKVALVYASDLEVLRGTYSYEEGQTVMVAVHQSLDAEEVTEKVREVLGVEDLAAVSVATSSNSQKIMLRRQ